MNKLLYFINMKEEELKTLYPFQYYTFKNLSVIKPYLDKYMFNMEHENENELFVGNFNGLLTMGDMLPNKMLKYFASNKNHKATFILPKNYKETVDGLIGFRDSILKIIEFFSEQISIFTYDIDNSDIINKIKETNMTFDVSICNPPYDGSLHLKILKEVIEHSNTVVNISPVRWLQDPIVEYKKNTDYSRYEDSILKHMIDFIDLDQSYTNECFGIQFNTKIGITVYNKTGGYDYKKIHTTEFNEIYKKCMSKKERISPNIKLYKDISSKNFIPVCLIGGHVDVNGYGVRFTRDRYKYFIDGKCQNIDRPELYNKEPNEVKSYNLKTFDTVPCIEFSTANETKNFYSYINTICFQYLTRGHTQDGHIYPNLLPFPVDYTNNWNDKLVCEYFNITGYIDNNHAVPNSEWEIILNTMKPYL